MTNLTQFSGIIPFKCPSRFHDNLPTTINTIQTIIDSPGILSSSIITHHRGTHPNTSTHITLKAAIHPCMKHIPVHQINFWLKVKQMEPSNLTQPTPIMKTIHQIPRTRTVPKMAMETALLVTRTTRMSPLTPDRNPARKKMTPKRQVKSLQKAATQAQILTTLNTS